MTSGRADGVVGGPLRLDLAHHEGAVVAGLAHQFLVPDQTGPVAGDLGEGPGGLGRRRHDLVRDRVARAGLVRLQRARPPQVVVVAAVLLDPAHPGLVLPAGGLGPAGPAGEGRHHHEGDGPHQPVRLACPIHRHSIAHRDAPAVELPQAGELCFARASERVMMLNTAPCGSATTASVPGSTSIGPMITWPPSSFTLFMAASVPSTAKYTPQ